MVNIFDPSRLAAESSTVIDLSSLQVAMSAPVAIEGKQGLAREIVSQQRVGDNLVIVYSDGTEEIIENYFLLEEEVEDEKLANTEGAVETEILPEGGAVQSDAFVSNAETVGLFDGKTLLAQASGAGVAGLGTAGTVAAVGAGLAAAVVAVKAANSSSKKTAITDSTGPTMKGSLSSSSSEVTFGFGSKLAKDSTVTLSAVNSKGKEVDLTTDGSTTNGSAKIATANEDTAKISGLTSKNLDDGSKLTLSYTAKDATSATKVVYGYYTNAAKDDGTLNDSNIILNGAAVFKLGASGQNVNVLNATSVRAGAGNDTITITSTNGNKGPTVEGEGGKDTITGGEGDDIINGGSGTDTLKGGAGNDTIDGGADDDTIEGGAGTDTITGGDGKDTLIGGAGADTITGGKGNDTINLFLENSSKAGTFDKADAADSDKVIFGTAKDNGTDTITGFAAKTGGDVLDFSALKLDGNDTSNTLSIASGSETFFNDTAAKVGGAGGALKKGSVYVINDTSAGSTKAKVEIDSTTFKINGVSKTLKSGDKVIIVYDSGDTATISQVELNGSSYTETQLATVDVKDLSDFAVANFMI